MKRRNSLISVAIVMSVILTMFATPAFAVDKSYTHDSEETIVREEPGEIPNSNEDYDLGHQDEYPVDPITPGISKEPGEIPDTASCKTEEPGEIPDTTEEPVPQQDTGLWAILTQITVQVRTITRSILQLLINSF